MASSKLDLKQIWQDSLQYKEEASAYLAKRGLSYSNEIGFLPYLNNAQYTLSTCLVIPVFSMNGVLTMLEFRTAAEGMRKQYLKIYADSKRDIPIFNLQNTLKSKRVVVTEGSLNAMTFNQLGFKIKAIATMRASVSIIMLHYLAYLYDEIIIAFDNDEAGQKNANRVVQFYETYYPNLEVSLLDYIYNDLNALLTKRGKKVARDLLLSQVEAR